MNALIPVVGQIGICLVTFAIVLVVSALLEWYLHAKVLHGPEDTEPFNAHSDHHVKNMKTDYKSTGHDEPGYGLAPMVFVQVMIIMLGLAFIAKFIFGGAIIFWTVTLTGLGYFVAVGYVHKRVHVPVGGWFEKTALYHHLDRCHRVHHARDDRNFCILAPTIADWMMGTLHQPSSNQHDIVVQ